MKKQYTLANTNLFFIITAGTGDMTTIPTTVEESIRIPRTRGITEDVNNTHSNALDL